MNIIPHVLKDHYCVGHIQRIQWKIRPRVRKPESVKADKQTSKSRPTHLIDLGPNHQGSSPGPVGDPLGEVGGEAGQPGCGRTLGVPAPLVTPLVPSFL